MNRLLLLWFGLPLFLPNAVLAAPRIVTLDVKNMVCPACPYSVKRSLEKVTGVAKVDVRFETREAIVTYDDSKTTPEALTDATAKAGFPATVKERATK